MSHNNNGNNNNNNGFARYHNFVSRSTGYNMWKHMNFDDDNQWEYFALNYPYMVFSVPGKRDFEQRVGSHQIRDWVYRDDIPSIYGRDIPPKRYPTEREARIAFFRKRPRDKEEEKEEDESSPHEEDQDPPSNEKYSRMDFGGDDDAQGGGGTMAVS